MPNVTHFSDLRVGRAEGRGSRYGVRGLDVVVGQRYTITPTAIVTGAVCATQSAAAAGNLTINGTLASGGVATLDVPRAVTVTSTGDDSPVNITITGTDAYGQTLVWTTTGPNAAATTSPKAFKTVTQVSVDTAVVSTLIAIGTGDRFGFPLKVAKRSDVLIWWDGTLTTTSSGFTAADSTGSAKSGDVRGTYSVQSAADATKVLDMVVFSADPDTTDGLFGTAQYSG
ncbi:MAG: hypothetical protein IPK85_02215 [Gemmatimonadetes bacterium]|nr:hypothetical protein [Gemmatimonadota bacterium]